MIWKFLKQNVLSPKGLNWVKHLVSWIGLLSDLKRWTKNRYIGNRTIIIPRVKQASTCHEHHAFRKKKVTKAWFTQSWCLLIKSTIANCCSCCRCRGGQYNNNNNCYWPLILITLPSLQKENGKRRTFSRVSKLQNGSHQLFYIFF